ncbi:endonuclease/exonuclease/phosphatase family protein [Cellulomonas sp. Y8]|uniref:endonuclease/exonuclease/phosphatase family protein n=1 Tax=Cellulomonas sp. Y8 TaxID=2591145 RepID=UPI001FEE448B|nr:endonuclease/exonuclease/phosphatase family protein [Cellulomonas sp. Y8]
MLAAGVLLLAAAAVVVLLAPDRLGLADRTPVAQLVALRGLVACLLVGGAVLLVGAVAGWRQVAGRAGVRRPGWRLPLALAGVLVLGAAAQAAVVVGRGVDGSGAGPAADGDLVVLSFNTFGVVEADDLTALVEQQDADLVVLAETSASTARAVARALTDAGRPTTALAADSESTRVEGVALLVRDSLGGYTQTSAGLPATELGTFAAVRAGGASTAYPARSDVPSDNAYTAYPGRGDVHSDNAYTAHPRRGDVPSDGAHTAPTAYPVDAHAEQTPASPGDTAYPVDTRAERTPASPDDTAYPVDTPAEHTPASPGDTAYPVDTPAEHTPASPGDTAYPVDTGSARTTPPAPDVVVAAHTRAPSAESSMPDWRAHAVGIAEVCRSTPGAIVAGDLNATLDHPGLDDLGPCVDAAAEVGAAGLGTWPADVPRVLAAPIDHVLVDGRAWRVTAFGVLDRVGASDHRPVVAHLARR